MSLKKKRTDEEALREFELVMGELDAVRRDHPDNIDMLRMLRDDYNGWLGVRLTIGGRPSSPDQEQLRWVLTTLGQLSMEHARRN